MKGRTLLTLAVLAAVALALVLLSNRGSQPGIQGGDERLLPRLKETVNDIEAITLSGAGDQTIVSLQRGTEHWQVAEYFDFEADFDRVRDMLRGLAEARLAEPKTAHEQWYSRLGVEDVASDDAGGVRIAFPGTDLPAVIIGDGAAAGDGRYVRLDGQEQSWLIDRDLDLPDTALGWLERTIVDIPVTDIERVVIRHPDGDVVQIRVTEPGEFELVDVPEDFEARASWEINQPAGALTNLRLEDVRPASDEALPEQAVRALFLTGDQLEFVATLFEDEQGHWVHFRVSADTPAVVDEVEDLSAEDNEARAGAGAADARLSPWLFRITESKYEAMTRRQEAMLVAPEDESS